MQGTEPQVGYGRDWWPSLAVLEGNEARQVADAMRIFLNDTAAPGLNLEMLHGDRRLHSIRATQSVRILLAREGNTYVFLEAGRHDDLYDRAKRMRFVSNPTTGFVGLVPISVDERPPEHAPVRAAEVTTDAPGVLDHWTTAELASAGFDDAAIEQLRTCRAEDDLCQLELSDEQIGLAIDLLELTYEQWSNPPIDGTADTDAETRIRAALAANPEWFTQLLSPEDAAAIATAPIEEWMVFLHPDQRHAATRQFAGPARVRGSAGTGKTVVALHRAAELARRFEAEGDAGKILFTTFIKSLPPVFESLYRRLPNAPAIRVEFVHVDRLAFRVCDEAGDRPRIEPPKANAAFAAAFKTVVTPGTPLHGFTREYLRSEVVSVIKGRGLRTVEDYLAVERTGRRTRFTEAHRRQAWLLREEWDRQLRLRNIVDFADVITNARDHARRRTEPTYRAVLIDEAQDLTLTGLQLLRALVNGSGLDRPDGLILVGDGGQRVYPGGFTLKQAGIDVRGRTLVLRTNYRNTRQIMNAALAVAGEQVVDDLGDEHRRDEGGGVGARRDGMRPVLRLCASKEAELDAVVAHITDIVSDGSAGFGDIAVAVATNDDADAVRLHLTVAGIAVQNLESYDGTPTDKVKVGTHFRIKGLEFKVVFLPFLGAEHFPRKQATGQDTAEYEEQCELAVSQLFVAMTRARDGLFVLCTGEPSSVLEPGIDQFEVI